MGRLAIAAAVFVLALAAYVATAYPTFAPRDAADLARAALTLGVAHPPGYPFYALLGHGWLTLLPWGEAAYRLNLLSAAAGAAAAGLLAAAAARRGAAAGWAAGLSLAFCAPLWKFSLLTEMYSLQACFAAGLLLLAEGGRATFTRRAAVSGLLAGLALVNHQSFALMLAPGLWLWRAEAKRLGLPLLSFWRAASPFFAAGLLLYAAVPMLLGDAALGWAVIRRAEYGTLTLFGGLALPWAKAAPGLLWHWLGGWFLSGSPALGAAGLAGLWLDRRSSWSRAAALGILVAGPGFFLLTRFDVSGWVARTALEPAFLLSTLWLCLGAGAAADFASRRRPAAGAGLAAAVALSALAFNGAPHFHRDDFGAWDYARGLLRTLPPGSSTVVRGDTALFSLRFLGRRLGDREVVSALEPGLEGWARQRGGRALFSVGLPLEEAERLGGARASAQGLALRLDGAGGDYWPFYAIRDFGALSRGETYARDAALAYGFARHTAARLAERSGGDGTHQAVAAAAWDPEDFRIEVEPAKGYNRPHAP